MTRITRMTILIRKAASWWGIGMYWIQNPET
jgi:hypothetical protein